MQTMEAKTAEGYRSSIRAFKKYLGSETIDINEINYSLLVKFKAWLESQYGKGCRAASYYLSCLRHIHRLAREEFNDDDVGVIRIPRQPFKSGLIPSQPVTEHRALTLQQVRSICNVEPKTSRGRLAKDVFLLSFALVGMNTIDLYYLKKSDLKDGKLSYNRHKTDSVRKDKAFIVVKVEEEALVIMNRYNGLKSLLNFADRYADHKSFNRNVNKGMKEIGDAIKVEGLNTGYARHSWATIARNDCSIPRETVDEALNHAERGGSRVTDIYIKRDFSRIWEANRKVLDLVNLPASDQSQEAAIEQKPLDGTEQ
jgi:integrase